MGLKSGSRDAGLDDGDADGEAAEGSERPDEERADRDDAADTADDTTADADDAPNGADTPADDAAGARPTVESLPYTLRRGTVNEGRSQVPFFLREEVIDGESDLQAALEAALDEEVYKSDYREAAMVVAQRNPELVAAVLREWGYDLDPV